MTNNLSILHTFPSRILPNPQKDKSAPAIRNALVKQVYDL